MRLAEKIAVVTGRGSGLGREITLQFAREGAGVMVVDRNEEPAQRTAEESRTAGGSTQSVRVDIFSPDDIAGMVKAPEVGFGRADILVNNAGVDFHRAFLDTTLQDFERVIRINPICTFRCSQAIVCLMVKQGGGRIINMASILGQRGGSGRSAYGASKAGVIQLTRVMAMELAHFGIQVNAIAPGPIQTPMTNHGPDQRRVFLERAALGRLGSAPDVAAAAVFLALDESSYETGPVLNVDGGIDAAGIVYSYEELTCLRSGPKEQPDAA